MDFKLFIIPLTYIVVELAKKSKISSDWLPHVAVLAGAVLGSVYQVYYGGDILSLVTQGVVYGAAASGIYDLAKSTKEVL